MPISRNEGGMTVAMVAIFIVVLFVMAALVIDMGVLYTARTSAQHVADAAALAGAYTFLNPAAVQPLAAQNAAINIAGQNSILGTPVNIAASDVAVDKANQMVTVTVSRLGANGIATFFANIIDVKAVDVQTKATAQVAKRATGTYCVRPFWLPNDVLGSCTKGQELFDANGNPTTYATSQLGTEISLWYKVTPSQWSLWDPSPYGADFSTAMQACINVSGGNVPVQCGDTLTTDNGAKVGQVLPAVQALLGPNPDIYLGIGQYQDGSTGQMKDTSPQLATVAIWDTCTNPISPGKQTFPVAGWATIFIESVGGPSSKTVNARLVGFSACALGGGGNNGTGPQAVPVRLVTTQ